MDEYNEIVEKFKALEDNQESLAGISSEYGFTKEETDEDDGNIGDRYEIFKASKQVGDYTLLIKVETRDNYRSFGGDDDEPYFNTLELWKDGELIGSKGYTYFK